MTMPSGIARVKGGPLPDLSHLFINELLGAELQAILARTAFAIPTNKDVKAPAGIPDASRVFTPDWAYVSKNRNAWVERWDKDWRSERSRLPRHRRRRQAVPGHRRHPGPGSRRRRR